MDGNTAVEWTNYYPPQANNNGGGFFGGGQSTESAPAKFTYFINGKVEKTRIQGYNGKQNPGRRDFVDCV